MDTNDDALSRIKRILKSQNYKIILEDLPKEFSWEPDILAKKNGELLALLIRKSNAIPEALIQRIAATKSSKNKLRTYLIVCQKPKASLIRIANLYGIGIKYLFKDTFSIIKQSKNFSTLKERVLKKETKKKKKMSRKDIFISSHQVIREREVAEELIDKLRDSNRWPIFAIKVEDDLRYDIKKTKKCIDANMENSELFLGILADEYRKKVNYEIRRSFKIFLVKNVFIFIKSLKIRPKKLTKLIEWIKKQKKAKYLEYVDVRDFEIKLMRTLVVKIKQIHKEQNIPFLE